MTHEHTETVTLRDGDASIVVRVKATPMVSDGSVAGVTVSLEGGSVLGVGLYAPAFGFGLPREILDSAAAWACDIAHGNTSTWGGRVSAPDPNSAPARAVKRAARVALMHGEFVRPATR